MADINDILRTIAVKNRVVDAQTVIQHDNQQIVWGPGETRWLPNRHYAEWFRGKSFYEPDTVTNQHKYRLCIVGVGQDESDLYAAALPKGVNWVNKVYVDPKTGKEFRQIEVPINGVPVMEPRRDAADAEVESKLAALGGKIEAAAEKMSSFSEDEIAAGLKELTIERRA